MVMTELLARLVLSPVTCPNTSDKRWQEFKVISRKTEKQHNIISIKEIFKILLAELPLVATE